MVAEGSLPHSTLDVRSIQTMWTSAAPFQETQFQFKNKGDYKHQTLLSIVILGSLSSAASITTESLALVIASAIQNEHANTFRFAHSFISVAPIDHLYNNT